MRGYRVSRDAWTFVIFGIAILTAIASVVAIGLALRDDDDGGDGGARRRQRASTPTLSEFAIALSAPSLDVGGSIEVTNSGSQVHNLGVSDTDLVTPDIEPGGYGDARPQQPRAGHVHAVLRDPGPRRVGDDDDAGDRCSLAAPRRGSGGRGGQATTQR